MKNRATDTILECRGLSKKYPTSPAWALKDISLQVKKGEIIGLLGPNGAGKTTAISIMSTLLLPTSGSVTVNNLNALTKPSQVRRYIGLVPQSLAFYPTMTARENLNYFATLYGLSKNLKKQRIQETLEFLDLTHKAGTKVATYSGGMKRRLNLAIGIIHNPLLLFLDEPTVGIDIQSRALILEKLKEMAKNGTAMVYTTHYMEEAEQLCDRVNILDEGNILAGGTTKELMEKGRFCNNLGELFLKLTGRDLRE